jgi:hypothetical protein
MEDSIMEITDDLENAVAKILTRKNIRFIHAYGRNQRLDFYLPDYDVYIEIKKFHSDRIIAQLRSQNNVIVIQGRKSIEFLNNIL